MKTKSNIRHEFYPIDIWENMEKLPFELSFHYNLVLMTPHRSLLDYSGRDLHLRNNDI